MSRKKMKYLKYMILVAIVCLFAMVNLISFVKLNRGKNNSKIVSAMPEKSSTVSSNMRCNEVNISDLAYLNDKSFILTSLNGNKTTSACMTGKTMMAEGKNAIVGNVNMFFYDNASKVVEPKDSVWTFKNGIPKDDGYLYQMLNNSNQYLTIDSNGNITFLDSVSENDTEYESYVFVRKNVIDLYKGDIIISNINKTQYLNFYGGSNNSKKYYLTWKEADRNSHFSLYEAEKEFDACVVFDIFGNLNKTELSSGKWSEYQPQLPDNMSNVQDITGNIIVPNIAGMEPENGRFIFYNNLSDVINGNAVIQGKDTTIFQDNSPGASHMWGREFNFKYWESKDIDGNTVILTPGSVISKNADGVIQMVDKDNKVHLFGNVISVSAKYEEFSNLVLISINETGTILDVAGSVTSRPNNIYTDFLAIGHIYLAKNTINTVGTDNIFASDADANIRSLFRTKYDNTDLNTQIVIEGIRNKNEFIPMTEMTTDKVDTQILNYLKENNIVLELRSSNTPQPTINFGEVDNIGNYQTRYYVLKKERSNGWHIDGVIMANSVNIPVTKKINGLSDSEKNQLMTYVDSNSFGIDVSVDENDAKPYFRLKTIDETSDRELNLYKYNGLLDGKYSWNIHCIDGEKYYFAEKNYELENYNCSRIANVYFKDGTVKKIDLSENPILGINAKNTEKIELEDTYTSKTLPVIIGSIEITKVDSKDNSKVLSGAEFKLEKLKDDGAGKFVVDENFSAIDKNTDDNGKIKFTNLEVGKYRVTEIKAPDNYNCLSAPVDFEITSDYFDIQKTIGNTKKTGLPGTGAFGKIGFYITGILSLVILLLVNKKVRVNKGGKRVVRDMRTMFKFSGGKRAKNNKKTLIILILIILLIQALIGSVKAVDYTKKSGSLEITRYGIYNNSESQVKNAIVGAKFSIYKVDSDTTSTTEPVGQPVQTLITGEDGKVKFNDLTLGRYLVVEKDVPSNVKDKVENFLVDIPMTNENGTDFIYDVEVNPKTEISYGSITLFNKNQDNEPLEGVKFLLQKKEGNVWRNYPSDDKATLMTDDEGKIMVDGFPEGNYRFVETDLGNNEGYILDNKTGYEFTVSFDNDKNAVVTPDVLNVVNEKLTVSKSIERITKSDKDTNDINRNLNSADKGDNISYKISADIPSKIDKLNVYKITDEINSNLLINDDSFKVYGVNKKTSEKSEIAKYTLNKTDNGFELTFSNSNLTEYNKIEIMYDAKLSENATVLQNGYSNNVKLCYSSIVKNAYDGSDNTDHISEVVNSSVVYTGGFKIVKRANKNNGKLLSGAEFKLATSLSNAQKGEFIKDCNGNEIVLTTDSNGNASYYGLAFGEYQLVETKAPVDEDGKTYNLLEKPQTITIDEKTYDSDITVINKNGAVLPFTGSASAGIFIVVGVSAFGLLIFSRKKMSK